MGWFSKVKRATKSATKRAGKGLDALHLSSVKENLNVKKLVTDPKAYLRDNARAYGRDTKHAGSVAQRYYTGKWKSLGEQALADTVTAFGGSRAQAAQAGSLGAALGEAYETVKGTSSPASSTRSSAAAAEADMKINWKKLSVKKLVSGATKAVGAYKSGDYSGAFDALKDSGVADAIGGDTQKASVAAMAPTRSTRATLASSSSVASGVLEASSSRPRTATSAARPGGLIDAILAIFGL